MGPACLLRCAESAAKTALERVEANDTAIESLPTSSPDGAMIGSHAKQNRGACVSTGRSGFALRAAHSAASVAAAQECSRWIIMTTPGTPLGVPFVKAVTERRAWLVERRLVAA